MWVLKTSRGCGFDRIIARQIANVQDYLREVTKLWQIETRLYIP